VWVEQYEAEAEALEGVKLAEGSALLVKALVSGALEVLERAV
jgi:hypothetical protein